MEFMELAERRFSVRKFSQRHVEKEKLDKLIEAGMLAPTAKNNQPQRIYVLQSKESLDKLDALTHCRYGAGTVLLFTYDTEGEWKNPLEEGIHSGTEDVSIIAAFMMMEAVELGLDTCWCNYFPNSSLEKAFDIPENEKAVLIMPVGYRAEGVVPSPMHNASKTKAEIVSFL